MARSDPEHYRRLARHEIAKNGTTAIEVALLHAILAKVDIEFDDIAAALVHATTAWTELPIGVEGVVVAEIAALLANALTLSNRTQDALDILDHAARRPGAVESGLIDVQRAAVHYRLGAMERALDAANAAVNWLDASRPVERARALNNRGIIRLYLGDLTSGWNDFDESEKLYRSVRLDRAAAEVAHNRSMIDARRGDIPRALAGFDAAESELVALGCPVDAQVVARAEILVQARLFDEVVDTLPAVVARMIKVGMHADADEGRVYIAQSMVALGLADAVAYIEEVATEFRANGRTGWAAVLDDLAIEARLTTGATPTGLTDHAITVADELDTLGMRWFAAGSWLRAAAVATANDDDASARTALEVVTSRRESVAERVLAYEAAARLALLDNRRVDALRAVRDGLAYVDVRRAAMEATELRAGVSGWGDGLAQLGVALANDAGRPRAMLAAVERWRASAMSSRPVRPPLDDEDAMLLGRLRSASASLGAALRSGRGVPEAEARMRQAEADVSRRARQQVAMSSARTERVMSTIQIVEEVADRTLIEFVDCSGDLIALVVRSGRVQRVEIGPVGPIRHACDAVMQVLRRLGVVVGTPAAGLVAASARAHLGRARALLAAPLAGVLGGSEIIVVPVPDLHDIPWAHVLGVSTPVAIAPSAREWVRAGRSTRGDHVVVVAGPGLPGAHEEAEQVADLHRPSQLLTHELATVARVGQLLDGASLAHLAAHATIRPSSPLFSSVQLADGPATAYDLEALQQAPRIMVLSACSAGSASKRSGGELIGLSTALMSAGTCCLIAPTIPIPDFGSIELVVAFHRQLCQGATTGEAVASVTRDIDNGDPAGLVSACTLTCYGRGDLRL